MDKKDMLEAFKRLDKRLRQPIRVIVGGGAALVTAYDVPLSTRDIDGVPGKSSLEPADFKELVHEVGRELKIDPDWLNDYFSTFLFVLPQDYGTRLVRIFKGKNLEAAALGKEDLILMKCFAAREKDMAHLRLLLKKKPDLKIVEARLDELAIKNIPGTGKAKDFLYDALDELNL